MLEHNELFNKVMNKINTKGKESERFLSHIKESLRFNKYVRFK